jgi:hypothetical protein
MELNYRQRSRLLAIVKQSRLDLWEEINTINSKFKQEDCSMINDKRAYWLEQQSEAYDRKMILDEIIYQINESL